MRRLIFIIGMMLLVTPLSFAQNGHDLFQKALQKERAEGNLEAAIALYARIVEEHASDRALVAKALVQMGQDYERLGRTEEAQRVFATVAREYADQAEAAQLARAKVTVARQEADGKESDITVRRLWTGSANDALSAALSRDGRYVAFTDWDTGNLAVRDLTTDQKSILTNTSWAENAEYAQDPLFSPDGQQVAYAWFNETSEVYELRLIRRDRSGLRVLYTNEEVTYVSPKDWSSDGRHILATLSRKDRTNQIALISVTDGTARVIKTLDWRYPLRMSLSPDGRYVVYDFPPIGDLTERDLYLLATDGSGEAPLVEHPANDVWPFWTPDGKHIVFFSDRASDMGAWVLTMVDGKPAGEPQLIKPDVGHIEPFGFSGKDSFAYTLLSGVNELYTASVDFETGKVLEPPVALRQRYGLSEGPAEWSPDGQYLAYQPYNGFAFSPLSEPRIIIRSLETDRERILVPDLNDLGGGPRWSPDGRAFLVHGTDEKNRRGLYLIDVQTGAATPVVQTPPESAWAICGGGSAWGTDSSSIYCVRRDPESGGMNVLRHDIETGQETVLFHTPAAVYPPSPRVSPDGQWFVYRGPDPADTSRVALIVRPMNGSSTRPVFSADGLTLFMWTPDGRYILFNKGWRSATSNLWRVSVETGEARKLGLQRDNLWHLRIHPDGKQVVFRIEENKAEIWVMEDFLPEDDGTK